MPLLLSVSCLWFETGVLICSCHHALALPTWTSRAISQLNASCSELPWTWCLITAIEKSLIQWQMTTGFQKKKWVLEKEVGQVEPAGDHVGHRVGRQLTSSKTVKRMRGWDETTWSGSSQKLDQPSQPRKRALHSPVFCLLLSFLNSRVSESQVYFYISITPTLRSLRQEGRHLNSRAA